MPDVPHVRRARERARLVDFGLTKSGGALGTAAGTTAEATEIRIWELRR